MSHAARTPAPASVTRRVLGLDLGKAVDFTALAVLEWTWPPPARPGGRTDLPVYQVRNLRRWPLGTSYTEIAAWLVRLFQSDEAKPRPGPPAAVRAPVLVADETGVGTAVVEMLREALVRAKAEGGLCGVTITAGSAVSMVPNVSGRWRVAKKELASVLVRLFQSRRLEIAEVPERLDLFREAMEFSVKITPAGNETFESWRESEHDDLVLALALACWAAESLAWGRPGGPP
jgi:hypothetical protein